MSYFPEGTWLAPSPYGRGAPSLTFADLQRIAFRDRARRRIGGGARGMGDCFGSAGPCVFALSPGDTCYDSTHSPGSTHFRFWFPGMSPVETSCLAGNLAITADPSKLAPGVPSGYDWSTGQVDASNVTGETDMSSPASAFGVVSPLTPNSSAAAALCAAGQTEFCGSPAAAPGSMFLFAAAAFAVIGVGMLLTRGRG